MSEGGGGGGGEGAGGVLSGWVEALAWCPHVEALPSLQESAVFGRMPRFDSFCQSCNDPQENWACLDCYNVLCGRYINGHMKDHAASTNHPMAISFRCLLKDLYGQGSRLLGPICLRYAFGRVHHPWGDLSVWCFQCDAYLDARVIKKLRPYFAALHLMKFGEFPPPPQSETNVDFTLNLEPDNIEERA